ncbi:hypothetical protein K469DRAFT_612999 [Zopfia rhizophila CBS 207.26]|uniref:Uncharacterized protein n=1 Tax=Zopfia rhizophila CBS 207.26 TaxID=1314779 RepID=A0A6A6D9A8_9PEZI|nr:hypothetical protein K469DRAFT_612999 [Zopfia rhizophila CBS 207.26]
MALELYIRPCTHEPPLCHSPPPNKPLRVHIQGPLESIQKLLPDASWCPIGPFPQRGGLKLASLTHQKLYRVNYAPKVRDEYLAYVIEGRIPLDRIDYYGVTFDHLVPANDPNPEVLAINIIEVDNDGGAYANEFLSFPVDVTEYTGKKVLAVPRCGQKKKGTQDRGRINSLVAERDYEIRT